MEEHRRSQRVALNATIATQQDSSISMGKSINISEDGIRYMRKMDTLNFTDKELYTEIDSITDVQPADVRIIYLALPGEIKSLYLVCSIVAEQIIDDRIETSGVFLSLADDMKLDIREYINKTVS